MTACLPTGVEGWSWKGLVGVAGRRKRRNCGRCWQFGLNEEGEDNASFRLVNFLPKSSLCTENYKDACQDFAHRIRTVTTTELSTARKKLRINVNLTLIVLTLFWAHSSNLKKQN
jgi:hypothetical protein